MNEWCLLRRVKWSASFLVTGRKCSSPSLGPAKEVPSVLAVCVLVGRCLQRARLCVEA